MKCVRANVLENRSLTQDIYLLTLSAPQVARSAAAGQFVQLRVSEQLDPLLRRPFSIHDWDEHKGTVDILYQVRGKGSTILSQVNPGTRLDVLGSLGNGFVVPQGKGRALLVGGGIGAAPLYGLGKRLTAAGWQVRVLLGAADSSLLGRPQAFSEVGETSISTDDGSSGVKGRVTSMLPLVAGEQFRQAYACGPKPMLSALAVWAESLQVPLQVSLDEVMACGMGVCLGCASPVRREGTVSYAKICTEGPVFDAGEVVWNE